jgi:hypothetical protein
MWLASVILEVHLIPAVREMRAVFCKTQTPTQFVIPAKAGNLMSDDKIPASAGMTGGSFSGSVYLV